MEMIKMIMTIGSGLQLGLLGAISVASAWYGVRHINKMNNFTRLDMDGEGSEMVNVGEIMCKIEGAMKRLMFKPASTSMVTANKVNVPVSHKPKYPDAGDARLMLSSILKKIRGIEDVYFVVRDVRDSLPFHNNVMWHEGKKVDGYTFKQHIELLDDATQGLKSLDTTSTGIATQGKKERWCP